MVLCWILENAAWRNLCLIELVQAIVDISS